MTPFPEDRLVFTPDDVDLAHSPIRIEAETYVLGAFNPGFTRLPNGNLLMMVRVAQALRDPVRAGAAHAIRWNGARYVLDAYDLAGLDLRDPRFFLLPTRHPTVALTSLSWLLPVELSPDGLSVATVHYDKIIAPTRSYQEYGVEDARISLIDGMYYMTACCVGAERHATCLYMSSDGLNYELHGLILDHQNKDMVLFEGRLGGRFYALTRPTGSLYFAYPPSAAYHAGPTINLATSPDALHWRPHEAPMIRLRKTSGADEKIGGGAPPILTPNGWLVLYHGVSSADLVGAYRTFWALLDADNPARILRLEDTNPLIEANAKLTAPFAERMYLSNIVFTTGIVDAGDRYIVASGEADLACRITHIDKHAFS